VSRCAHEERCAQCRSRLRCRGCEPKATPTAAPAGRSCLRAACMASVKAAGEPKVIRAPRQAPPLPERVTLACLRVLAEEEGRALRAGEVAELAGTSPALSGRALRVLAENHTVEHAEGSRGIPGALVRRVGVDRWEATWLGLERVRNALNDAPAAERLADALAARADDDEAARAVRELEREVAALRARLAEVEGDTSFDVARECVA
jgi:hypothetical protein